MLDLLIKGGEVVDGTGSARWAADVAVHHGRIVAIAPAGSLSSPAANTIDASGLVVAPGFVDLHTHFDAQLFWDASCTPSVLHGVTTVIGGNCGFSIAPMEPDQVGYLTEMLARVEGMPLEALRGGVPWTWRHFDEYLTALDGRISVNAGFLVGHSTIRRLALGADSERAATPDERAQIESMLRVSLEAGGLGFSSSHSRSHNDAAGRPVPSRFADRDEVLALCGVLREHPGTTVEYIPTVGPFTAEHIELMAEMSTAAERPVNWNLLTVLGADSGPVCEQQLSASDVAAHRGGRVVALTLPEPVQLRLNFASGMALDFIPGWAPLFELSAVDRLVGLQDPRQRAELEGALRSAAARGGLVASFLPELLVVGETFSTANEGLVGASIQDIACERGQEPFDCLLDIVVADALLTSLLPPALGTDDLSWRLRAEMWRDPRTLIGGSDAGAHVDMISTFTYSTSTLAAARDRGLADLEEVVHMLTDAPARLYGLRDRGRLAVGWHADIVVFDPLGVRPGAVHTRYDLPGAAGRLFAEAEGVEHVLVNGVEISRHGQLTGALPGTVLRSGRDTETVHP